MMRWLTVVLALVVVVACGCVPVVLAVLQQQHTKNFHIVRDGVLYRSGQMTLPGLRRVSHDYRIRTVVNLRDGLDAQDRAEEAFCLKQEIRFVRLLPRSWDGGPGNADVDDNVRTFPDIVRDPANHPVLVHCFAGIHRTGAYCALYRMEFDGWGNDQALEEVRAHGYTNLDREDDVRGYLSGYRKGRFDLLTLGAASR